MTIVAFQGEHGAFSEEAIYQHFGKEVTPLPCRAFEDIFDAVVNGQADYAAVPVENSLIFAGQLRQHGVPFELHIYPKGRHGLGLNTELAWGAAALCWISAFIRRS